MPTADNLNDMDSWSNRRAYVQREFLANRDRAQEHASENLNTSSAGAAFGPPTPPPPAPRLVTLQQLRRTIEKTCAEQGIPCSDPRNGGRLRNPRDRE